MSLQNLLDKTKEEFEKKYVIHCSDGDILDGMVDANKVKKFITNSQLAVIEEVINELESNPNEDGSISPNIQHFIEKKQSQLRKIINQLTIKK